MKALRIIHQRIHKRAYRFLLILSLFIILSAGGFLSVQETRAATAVYTVNINALNGMWPPPSAVMNPVELAGNFSVQSGSGSEKDYGIQIGWGDGSPYTVWRYSDSGNAYPYLTWSPNDPDGKFFNGTFNTNPGGGYQDLGHIYTAEGNYTITVKLFHGQPPGADSSEVTVSLTQHVLVPMLSVSKLGPAYAHEGDTINYNVTVTNPSTSTTMYKVSVIDSILGDISGSFSSSLLPLHSESKTYNYTVPSPSVEISNNVTATYKDAANQQRNASASWNVTVLHPNIQVTKVGPAYAHEGDTINYNITVINTGDCPLYNISVNDTLLGPISLDSLAVGQNQTFILTSVVPSTPEINNTAIASGFDILGLGVSDTSSWFVMVQYPITVTASPIGANGGTFNATYTVNGTTYTSVEETTTWTEWVDAGTTVTISSPQDILSGGPGIRYRFDYFDPSASIVITGSTNVTLMYTTQYYLTVASPYETPAGEGWYDQGDTAYVMLINGTSDIIPGQIRAVFTGWSGDASGTTFTSNPIVMDSPKTAAADWKTQYYIAVTSAHGFPTVSAWIDEGGNFTASVTSPTEVVPNVSQWVCTGFSLDGGSSLVGTSYNFTDIQMAHNITFSWKQQFWIQVNSAHDSPTISQWVDQGGSLTVGVTSPSDDDGIGTRYRCTGYTLDSNASIMDGSISYNFLNVQSAHIITFNWIVQYRLTIVSDHGSSDPAVGEHWYDSEEVVSASVTSPADDNGAGTRYRCIGWSETGIIPILESANSVSFIITQPSTLRWNWIAQYYLAVFSAHDSPTPESGWFDEGTSVVTSVSSPVAGSTGTRYACTGWSGTGSVPASGSGTAVTFTINASSTLTWNWIVQYYLTVTSSHDFPTGEGWYNAGTNASSSVTSPFNEGADIRYVALGFMGTGSTPSAGIGTQVSFQITMPSIITWNWKTQYLVAFVQTGLDASAVETVVAINGSAKIYDSLPFQQWIDEGSQVNYFYENIILSSHTDTRFLLESTTNIVSPINITTPLTVVGNYKTQFYLTVTSAYATSIPTSGWFDVGTLINASITSPFPGSAGTRYVCPGWTGIGSVSASGTDNFVAFIISEPSSLTWNWKTQYYLVFSTNFGTVHPGNGWYDESSIVPINASVPADETQDFQWRGWTGEGTGSYSGLANPASVAMNGPINETSYWRIIPNLTIFISNETIARCDRIAVYGTTSPVSSVVGLEITYTSPSGTQITHMVLTYDEGRYSDVFVLENANPYGLFTQSGQWTITANRPEDVSHEAGSSYTTVGIKALDVNLFVLAILALSVAVAVVVSYLLIEKAIKDKRLKANAWRKATIILGLTGLVFGIIALFPNWISVQGTALINGQTYLVDFSLNPFQNGPVSITGIKYAGTEMPSLISSAWSAVPKNPGPIMTLYLIPVGCALALASLYKPKTKKERMVKILTLMAAGAFMMIPIVSSIIFMAVQSSVVTGASTGYALGLYAAMIGGLVTLLSSAFAEREPLPETRRQLNN